MLVSACFRSGASKPACGLGKLDPRMVQSEQGYADLALLKTRERSCLSGVSTTNRHITGYAWTIPPCGSLNLNPPLACAWRTGSKILKSRSWVSCRLYRQYVTFVLCDEEPPRSGQEHTNWYDVALCCVTLRYVALCCVSYLFRVQVMLRVNGVVSNAHPAWFGRMIAVGTQPCSIHVHD